MRCQKPLTSRREQWARDLHSLSDPSASGPTAAVDPCPTSGFPYRCHPLERQARALCLRRVKASDVHHFFLLRKTELGYALTG